MRTIADREHPIAVRVAFDRLGEYDARVERAFVLRVEGFDWNCPQHITPRFTEDEIRESVAPLLAQLAAAEAENKELRAALAKRPLAQ